MKRILFFAVSILLFTMASCEGNEPNSENDKYENGHEYVDLGLPSGTLWATCNIGATTPENGGYYFQFSSTKPMRIGEYCSKFHDYYVENKINKLELLDDAAHINWGGRWRIATSEEFQEIKDLCSWVWGTRSSADGFETQGYLIIGPSGKSIFLPAVGYKTNDHIYDKNDGYYMTTDIIYEGYNVYFNINKSDIDLCSTNYYGPDTYDGLSLRPVFSR